MARVKITEYRAKKMISGDEYSGLSFGAKLGKIPKGEWVAKVDQGVKKRGLQGLVRKGRGSELLNAMKTWKKKGFSRFIVEPAIPHDDNEERYLSLERVRDGIQLLYAPQGGVHIEKHPETVVSYLLTGNVAEISESIGIPQEFLAHLINLFQTQYIAFLEINPLIVKEGRAVALDAAVLVDSAGEYFADAWDENDVVETVATHRSEKAVNALASTTPASLTLTVLNPDGSLFFLLSGGGGSIVLADAVASSGMASSIGNYGEYSGGPSRQETYLYSREVLKLLLDSRAKKKALVIAGGVANFTDVKTTFEGIIDALSEVEGEMREQKIKVFVRRGGPNERDGLLLMERFLEKAGILGSVHGSDFVITSAVEEAIEQLRI